MQDDGVSEPNGLTVGLRLTPTPGAIVGLASATLNILDNDLTPGYLTFASASYVTNLSGGAVTLEIDRRGANKGTLSVQCITTNITAIDGVNYIGGSNTLSWSDSDPMLARYITIPLINNGHVGPNTIFRAYLTNAIWNQTNTPGVLASSPTATTVTVVNDNAYGKLQFSAPPTRSMRTAAILPSPSFAPAGRPRHSLLPILLPMARWLRPQGRCPTTLASPIRSTFNPGEVAKTFNVSILNDGMTNDPPSDFWFTVNLSSPSQPGSIGYPSSARVYIVDAQRFTYPAGSPDSFDPNPGFNGDVFDVALQPNGQILAAGDFTVVNNYPRNHIARLNPTALWTPRSSINWPGPTARSRRSCSKATGACWSPVRLHRLIACNRNGLARLMSDGTLDSSFNSAAGGRQRCLCDGRDVHA